MGGDSARGQDALAVRVSRRLVSEEGLITEYSGVRLRMDLDRIPLWRPTLTTRSPRSSGRPTRSTCTCRGFAIRARSRGDSQRHLRAHMADRHVRLRRRLRRGQEAIPWTDRRTTGRRRARRLSARGEAEAARAQLDAEPRPGDPAPGEPMPGPSERGPGPSLTAVGAVALLRSRHARAGAAAT